MVLFDPLNGNFYVRGSNGVTLTEVNATTDSVLTSLTIGYGGSAYIPNVPTMVIDSTNGYLYETSPSANGVGVVQTSTDTLSASITVGGSPGGIVFDPTSGDLYTSNWVNDTVSVLSGATNTLLTSVAVGKEPGAILYDPADQEVFVSNFNSGNVSVINTTTNAVVANPVTGTASGEPVALTLNTKDDLVNVVNSITGNVTVINGTTNAAVASVGVGSVPTSATYVPSTDTLLVANGASNNVSVIQQPRNTVIANPAIGHGAQGAAEDPVSGDVYIADYGANSVAILDPSNNSLVATVTTGNFPEEIGVDTASGNVYVANLGTAQSDSNLTVISGTTSGSIASITLVTYPTSLTAASNGNVYAIDHGGADAYIVPESTNRESGMAPSDAAGPVASAFDSATGDLYIVSAGTGTVNVVTGTGSPVTTLQLGFDTDGVAYDAANGKVYVSNYYSGNVTILNGATETVSSVLVVHAFDSLGAEIYDPVSHDVYVADYSYHNVTVIHGAATNGSIQVGTDPTSFAYDPQNDTIFVANYGSGNVSVINASTDQVVGSVSGYFPQYLAYDAATNSVYVASGENGQITAFNATTYASLGSPLDIASSTASGGIAYGASSGDIYVSNTYVSSISILSNVAAGPNTTYPVTFIESGLTGGKTWAITLGGNASLSNLTDIAFEEPNGSYAFTVASVPGYVSNVSSGDVTVTGAAQTRYIGFSAVAVGSNYSLQFNESGLPQGTTWGVTLTPAAANGVPTASAPSPVVLSAPNGSYDYTVHSVSGFSSSPGSGTVVISGAPRYVVIAFTATPTPLTAALAIDPSTLALGGSATLTTNAAGGAPAYSYTYGGLPAGCVSTNAATLHCTPTATGNFSITVNVSDTAGDYALAHATLRVTGSVGTSASNGSSSLEWWIIVALVILFALLVLLFLWRRKRTPEPALPSPPPGPGPTPPPP